MRKYYMHSQAAEAAAFVCPSVFFAEHPKIRNPSSRLFSHTRARSSLAHLSDPPLLRPLFVSHTADHEELAAAESFNREMAELAELEHQHELRSLLQARITGEETCVSMCRSNSQQSQRSKDPVSLFRRVSRVCRVSSVECLALLPCRWVYPPPLAAPGARASLGHARAGGSRGRIYRFFRHVRQTQDLFVALQMC